MFFNYNNNQSIITVSDVDNYIAENFLKYKPHSKQLLFHELGIKAIERKFEAGNRTGKSFSGSAEVCMHATGKYIKDWVGHRFNNPVKIWVCATTYTAVKNYLQPYFLGEDAVMPQHKIIKVSYVSHPLRPVAYMAIRHPKGVSEIVFKSYDQGVKEYQGAKIDFIMLDEEPSYDIYEECKLRIMTGSDGKMGRIIFTSTPKLGKNQLYVYYKKRYDKSTNTYYDVDSNAVIDGRCYIKASWNDNPALSEEAKNHIRKSTPQYLLRTVEFGDVINSESSVYSFPDELITCDSFEIPDYFVRFAGMDVGWHNTAVVFCALDRDRDIIYIYNDYKKGKLQPKQHAAVLCNMGLDWIPTACDVAARQVEKNDGKPLKELYEEAGLHLYDAKNQGKENIIAEIVERACSGRLKIFKNCVKLLEEKRGYSRDDEGVIICRDDHLIDAMHYGLRTGIKYGISKKEHDINKEYNYSYVNRRKPVLI